LRIVLRGASVGEQPLAQVDLQIQSAQAELAMVRARTAVDIQTQIAGREMTQELVTTLAPTRSFVGTAVVFLFMGLVLAVLFASRHGRSGARSNRHRSGTGRREPAVHGEDDRGSREAVTLVAPTCIHSAWSDEWILPRVDDVTACRYCARTSPGDLMKMSFAVLVLALPTVLAAQQTQPPANPITTAFRNRTLTLQRNIAQAFDSIPESKFGYKPTPAQLTIGYIAQHLVSDNYLFCNAFGEMKGAQSAKDTTTADSIKATWPRDTLLAKLKASFAFCENAFGQLDDTKISESVELSFGGTKRTLGRVNMVLGHALDVADHYSQLANYMRLNNIVPPTALPRPGRGGGR
jgi:hypothetical protein